MRKRLHLKRKLLHLITGHIVPPRPDGRGGQWSYNNPPNGIKFCKCVCGHVSYKPYPVRGPYKQKALTVDDFSTRYPDDNDAHP